MTDEPTLKQYSFLQKKGKWVEGMTKQQAHEAIALIIPPAIAPKTPMAEIVKNEQGEIVEVVDMTGTASSDEKPKEEPKETHKETPKEEPKEEPKKQAPLEEIKETLEILKKEKAEVLVIKNELSKLREDQLLSGTAGGHIEPKPKEETPKEYNDRIDKEMSEGKHDD